ncbi:MAG: hypothetical protein WAM91_13690 [Candidatus Acidiferrales bacterium]
MAKVADETASVLAELAKRIDDLAQRVLALEHASPGTPAASTPSAQESDSFQPPAVSLPAGTISILGRAVLGIALAYLFRAASESAILPRPLLVISAILYSSIWLILSVRLRPSDGFARAVYALTAVLILSPLLWEATVRFRILSPIAAAGALTAFTVFGLVLSLRFDLRAAPFILVLAAVPTAVALVIGAGAVTPFVFSLLVIALVVELGACRGNWPYLRPVIAAAADFIIWLMTYLLARPEGPLSSYSPANELTLVILPVALFAVYGASAAYRTIVRRLPITIFEIAQLPVACLLAMSGVAAATIGTAIPALGVSALVLAAASYLAAFTRSPQAEQKRNFLVFSFYAVALFVIGIWLLCPAWMQTSFFCLAAPAATVIGMARKIAVLRYQALVFLFGACLAGGFFPFTAHAFVGANPGAIGWTILAVALTALVCYITVWKLDDRGWTDHLLAFFPMFLAAVALAGCAVILLVGFVARWTAPEAHALAVIRTGIICASAFAFGLLASRFKRVELVWAAYCALAFGAVKLFLEDLWLQRKEWLAVSLFLYALVLILLPRILRGVAKRT